MPNSQQQNQKPSKDTNIRILIAFLLGIAVMALFAYTGMDFLLGNLRTILGIIVFLSVFIILALYLINRYKEVLFFKLLGVDNTDLKDVETNTKELIKDIASNNLSEATDKATHIGKKVFAWYAWKMYRQYVLQVVQAIFVVFGGIIGSYLLFVQNEKIDNQNELIQKQNQRLDQQTYLQEADRRSSLVFLFSNIMDAIDRELRDDVEEKGVRDLSPQLIGRIISLSQRLKPYQYLEGDTLIGKPLSPERGQLFNNLLYAQLDTNTQDQLFYSCTFDYMEYNNTGFREFDFVYVRASHASLYKNTFSQMYFYKTDLGGADLRNTTFRQYSIFVDNYLDGANMSGVIFDNCIVEDNWLDKIQEMGQDSIIGTYQIIQTHEARDTILRGASYDILTKKK